MSDMSSGKNLVLSTAITAAGMILFIVIGFIYLYTTGHQIFYDLNMDAFLPFALTFPMILFLPMSAIYARKLFEKTGNVYLGALLNAMIFTWANVSSLTSHVSMYL
jgi:CDP-diglyceride synthetase